MEASCIGPFEAAVTKDWVVGSSVEGKIEITIKRVASCIGLIEAAINIEEVATKITIKGVVVNTKVEASFVQAKHMAAATQR